MKAALAQLLRRWASKLHSEQEEISIFDEYGICRCRLLIMVDNAVHDIEAKLVRLPDGWRFEEHGI